MLCVVQANKDDLSSIYHIEVEIFGSHGYPAFLYDKHLIVGIMDY